MIKFNSGYTLLAIGLVAVGSACNTASKKAATAPQASSSPAAVASPAPSVKPSPKAGAAAKATEKGTRLDVKCEQGADKRLLTVVPTDQGCELHYGKFGASEVIANSVRGVTTHCDQVLAKVRKNLEGSGFTCQ